MMSELVVHAQLEWSFMSFGDLYPVPELKKNDIHEVIVIIKIDFTMSEIAWSSNA